MPTLAHQEYLDALPSEWQRVRLGELGDVYAGSTPRRSEPKYWGGHIPWLTPSQVTGRADKWVRGTDEYITEEGFESTSVHLVPDGSLLVTTRATIGEVVIADVPITTNQGFKNLVLEGEDVSLFYYYALRFVADEMERLASGSTFDEISKSDFVDIIVPRPSPAEQRRIADVLDTVDAAIQETDAVIDKQEQVKTGLLQDLLTRGLDANGRLRDPERNPEAFRDTELGRLPAAWNIVRLGEVLHEIQAGKSPSCPDIPAPSGEWGVVKVSAIRPEGFQAKENKVIEDEKHIRPEYEIHDGDLLISRANTSELVGITCLVKDPPDKLMLCDKSLRLVPQREAVTVPFLFHATQVDSFRRQVVAAGTGSSGTMKNISQSDIRGFQVPLPPIGEQLQITDRVESTTRRIDSETAYHNKLQHLKTGLMQDLLTGCVRVPEAEARVEEVVA